MQRSKVNQPKSKEGGRGSLSKKELPPPTSKPEKEQKQTIISKPAPQERERTQQTDSEIKAPAPAPSFHRKEQGYKGEPGSHKPFVEHYDIPPAYNTTNLTLITRDPHWIYAYWEIAPSSIDEVRNKIGGDELGRSSYVLRMYDVSCIDFNGYNANRWFDIDVGPYTNNWYINLWSDNVTYCADIGIRTSDGRFFTVARSNFVTTPRQGSSGRADMIWMEVKEDFEAPPYVIAEPPKRRQPLSPDLSKLNSLQTAKRHSRKIYLTEDDIRSYYSKLFPLLRRVTSKRQSKKSKYPFTYFLKDGNILLEKFLIRGLSRDKFFKKILLGSSEELVLMGASESVGEEKGGASEREKKKRQFFFEIGTELIVYGRTEPDAEVWLGDKKIKLREDGTFTLRLALPDGKIPLDFVAQSSDKVEKRSISTEVERKKTQTTETQS